MPHKSPEAKREYQKKYRERNAEKIREYQRTYTQNNDLSEYKSNWYSRKKYSKYGITEEIFLSTLGRQENKCVVCFSEFTEKLKPYIDHCHTTNRFRGLLCFHCNTALGHFRDSIPSLNSAIRYLTNE